MTEDKSVVNLLKAYANAERTVLSASRNNKLTVKQYQAHLTQVVNESVAMLNKKNRSFGQGETVNAFSEGKEKTDSQTPQEHGHMTQKQASDVLKRAGFRYDAREFGYDTYVELQSATQAAGKGFLERVNKTISDLKKSGKDTIYNVTQAVKKDIEEQGLLTVEYSNGRKVSVSSYAAMAARSARMESANIGAFGRALENGTDYVRCTEIWPTCEICARYQGRIYCISGKDRRFPALFETALRRGYALMHPNCRHEFIPVWLELMDKADLEKEIRRSQIPKASDPRLPEERNAYADWQAERRQVYNEHAYFEKARQTLGPSMPYKDIGAFRRSYRAKEGSLAHQRSHNLIRDYQKYTDYKQVLKEDPDFPKTLAKFQEIKYNKDVITYQRLKRENATISSIKKKGWSETFTKKAISAYYEFKAKNIEFTDHGIARYLSRNFNVETIEKINGRPFNYYQDDGKKVKFYDGIAIIYSGENDLVVSVIERKNIKEDWHEINN